MKKVLKIALIVIICSVALFWIIIETSPEIATRLGYASGPGKPIDAQATQENVPHVFRAEVIEISNGTMLVKPLQGYSEADYAQQIRVEIQNMPSSPEPVAGDIVEITYSGIMMEVYPPVPSGVEKIVVVNDVE